MYASVSHLKSIQRQEENSIVKLAPALTKKVLHPTSDERQNVSLCVKFFDEKNIAALEYFNSDSNAQPNMAGTIMFLDIILRWWKTVNVKFEFNEV